MEAVSAASKAMLFCYIDKMQNTTTQCGYLRNPYKGGKLLQHNFIYIYMRTEIISPPLHSTMQKNTLK